MTSKRYVLLEFDREVTAAGRKALARYLEQKFGELRLIPIDGNERALVVKTDNVNAPLIREVSRELSFGGGGVKCILTSGSIGKLKRRASGRGASAVGKVP